LVVTTCQSGIYFSVKRFTYCKLKNVFINYFCNTFWKFPHLTIESLFLGNKVLFILTWLKSQMNFFTFFFWGGGKDIENGLDFAKRSAIPNFIFIYWNVASLVIKSLKALLYFIKLKVSLQCCFTQNEHFCISKYCFIKDTNSSKKLLQNGLLAHTWLQIFKDIFNFHSNSSTSPSHILDFHFLRRCLEDIWSCS